jgi:hypothetical protein
MRLPKSMPIQQLANSTVPPQLSELKLLAGAAVSRIRTGSELQRGWSETPSYADWLTAMDDLLSRLR